MTDRTQGILNRASDAPKVSGVRWILGDGVLTNYMQSYVDDTMKRNEITPLNPIPSKVKEENHDHGSIRDLKEVEIVRLSDEEIEKMHEKGRADAKRRMRIRTATGRFWSEG